MMPAIELASAADQSRWGSAVRIVQAALPLDPDMPGMTRPSGAANTKNGAVVKRLKPRTPIDLQEVLTFLGRVGEAPFKEIATVLFGQSRVQPCPVCRGEGSRLGVLDARRANKNSPPGIRRAVNQAYFASTKALLALPSDPSAFIL